ncbi:hypothetical protein [Aquitalea sp. ASV15]|uniref:hypothetical protein n=1 Tax=Aquitalea sp. ASV15 TaxID=2795104 RepID=UPI0018EC08D0|nr:hypothetical protein [Aquitalea sp. ASV15]
MNLSVPLIPAWAKALAIGAGLAFITYQVHHLGYEVGAADQNKTDEKVRLGLVADYEKQLGKFKDQWAAELATALRDKQALEQQANQVGAALLDTRAQLARTQQQLKQEIPHVVQADGPRWTGIGPASLRLYSQNLGYTVASGSPSLPAANPGDAAKADQASSAEAGLSPTDLLTHSADYGQWCQKLEQQLDAFITLHTKDAP